METYAAPMVTRIGPQKPRQRAYIREHRKGRGWSQDKLAALLDTTAPTISRYETGTRDYPGGFLAAVAEAFGISEGDLYRLPDAQPVAGEDAPTFESMLRDAPPAIRELAEAAAKAILETHRRQEPPAEEPRKVVKK